MRAFIILWWLFSVPKSGCLVPKGGFHKKGGIDKLLTNYGRISTYQIDRVLLLIVMDFFFIRKSHSWSIARIERFIIPVRIIQLKNTSLEIKLLDARQTRSCATDNVVGSRPSPWSLISGQEIIVSDPTTTTRGICATGGSGTVAVLNWYSNPSGSGLTSLSFNTCLVWDKDSYLQTYHGLTVSNLTVSNYM